jgi:hypothetical protein
MREFSARYESSDVVYAQRKAMPLVDYYYRAPISRLIVLRSIRRIKFEDIGAERFWLILKWPKPDEVSSLISAAERQYKLIYATTEPDLRLQIYLFERRN